jgi:hypothetical protein
LSCDTKQSILYLWLQSIKNNNATLDCKSWWHCKKQNLMANLEGRYDLTKSFLVSQSDHSFRIGITTRTNASGNQPPLILYLPLPKGRREYLSGLFPVNNGQIMTRQGYSPSIVADAQNGQIIAGQTYSLDYAGQYFLMEVDSLEPVVTIFPANRPGKRRLKSQSPMYINRTLYPSRRQTAQPKGVKNKVKTMCRHSEKQYSIPVNQLFIDFQASQNDLKNYES